MTAATWAGNTLTLIFLAATAEVAARWANPALMTSSYHSLSVAGIVVAAVVAWPLSVRRNQENTDV